MTLTNNVFTIDRENRIVKETSHSGVETYTMCEIKTNKIECLGYESDLTFSAGLMSAIFILFFCTGVVSTVFGAINFIFDRY